MAEKTEKRFYQEERRTFPCYLTDDEFDRERRRLDNMVDEILKWVPCEKVGETENFIIEIDSKEKVVYIKEKKIVVDCPFKLSMKPNEVKAIIKQLTKVIRRLVHKKIKAYSVEEIRKNHPKAYSKWTPEEDQQLTIGHKQGIPVSELAKIHQRKTGAIRSRLIRLGIVSD